MFKVFEEHWHIIPPTPDPVHPHHNVKRDTNPLKIANIVKYTGCLRGLDLLSVTWQTLAKLIQMSVTTGCTIYNNIQYLGAGNPITFQKSCPTNPAYSGGHDCKTSEWEMTWLTSTMHLPLLKIISENILSSNFIKLILILNKKKTFRCISLITLVTYYQSICFLSKIKYWLKKIEQYYFFKSSLFAIPSFQQLKVKARLPKPSKLFFLFLDEIQSILHFDIWLIFFSSFMLLAGFHEKQNKELIHHTC